MPKPQVAPKGQGMATALTPPPGPGVLCGDSEQPTALPPAAAPLGPPGLEAQWYPEVLGREWADVSCPPAQALGMRITPDGGSLPS